MRDDKFIKKSIDTLASIARVALKSRGAKKRKSTSKDKEIVILGNGPSLTHTLEHLPEWLADKEKIAVNFAANTDIFFSLKPRYYVVADPHFIGATATDSNVKKLWEAFSRVDWKMTLFVARPHKKAVENLVANDNIEIKEFNMVAADGFAPIRNSLFDMGLAMARPRNVLIVSIMLAIAEGYGKIYLAGADHSWSKTLWVDDNNHVMSRQPHFYKDNEEEHKRVDTTYAGIKLHEIYNSFAIAFKSYYVIREYAEKRGVEIFNISPGSFIDAFERKGIKDLKK